MTGRQFEILQSLDDEQWLRPMDVGGRDAAHHLASGPTSLKYLMK